jgi:hypothetical protein
VFAGGATGRLRGSAGRWSPEMTQDWTPVRPDLVCEVTYDQLDAPPADVRELLPAS